MASEQKLSIYLMTLGLKISIIQQVYPSASHKDMLAALPGRSISQIQNKANSLSITRNKPVRKTKEEVRESKRAHMERRRRSDPDGVRAYQLKKYHENKERNLEAMKRYQRKRYFWRRAIKFALVTASDLSALWKRQRGRCALTGRKLDRSAHLDHIVARARGGTDELSNLRWVCKEVNLARRELSDQEFLALCSDCMHWIGKRISQHLNNKGEN